jgi:hypothetical protein
MYRSILFVIAALALLSPMPLAAQDAILGQVYGSGVHAYFGEDFVKAHQLLTTAIDGHTQDPRAFYFRGLALLKLGRPQEAEGDFQQGAKLESAIDPARAYNVARSLERVQGSDRAKLEQFRLEARMTMLKKAEDERAQRYQATLKEQREFLQRQSEAGVARPVEPAKVPADPFSTGDGGKTPEPKKEGPGELATESVPAAETPAEKPIAKPDAKKPAESDDPFGPETTKPAAPVGSSKKSDMAKPVVGEDPFGPETTKPAAPATKSKKSDTDKPAADDDPFGARSAAAKPAAPAASKASSKSPDTAKPAAEADDPFSPEPAKPAASAPATKKPEAAKPSGDDDPFAPLPAPARP